MITLAVLLKITSPKASVFLSLEKNINIAYLANYILQPCPLEVSPLPIDPETSRAITALRFL
jgi:hypothetical protein